MKTIVVATDFSSRSDRAMRRALLLAKPFGAELVFAHVLDDDQPSRRLEAERREADALLTQLSLSVRNVDGLSCSHRIGTGEAFQGIVRIAQDAQADLIVLGPHRRQILQDIFVGTTAERTIRHSHIPILMANGPPVAAHARVMIATDLSPASANVVATFQRLGSPHMRANEIMHAFAAPAQSQMRRAMLDNEAISDYLADEEDAAREAIVKFCTEVGEPNAKRVLKPVNTHAAFAILEAAAASKADLLVVGVRSRMGLERLLLGSIAEKVLAAAEIDVLAIPPEES